MHTYVAYNLCIQSEIPLPELVIADGIPDVIIRLGTLHHIDRMAIDFGDRVVGSLPEIGTFLIESGREIVVEPASGVDISTLSPTILGPVMSVVLRQRGLFVIHASSVSINGQVVAFMGRSGWGKSTLAEAFHQKGYNVLTDDVMALKFDTACPIVVPSFPQFKLCPDAATSLGHNIQNLPSLSPNALKLSYTFSHGFQQTPLPLHRIYVLGKGTKHAIERLQPQQAFVELVRHTRSVSVLVAPDRVISHLRQCTSLVNAVTICRFVRQPSLAALPELVKLVEEDVAKQL
jgi:hypothetical protein